MTPNEYCVEGILVVKTPVEEIKTRDERTLQKQSIVVEFQSNNGYPNRVCVEFLGDRVGLINQFSEGQTINVAFDINSREYNGRWFTSLRGYRIQYPAAGYAQYPPQQGSYGQQGPYPQTPYPPQQGGYPPSSGYGQQGGYPQPPTPQSPPPAFPQQQPPTSTPSPATPRGGDDLPF